MPSTRPYTTLLSLQSIDGKVSFGSSDVLDFDRDGPHIPGIAEGLEQFYEREKKHLSVVCTSGKTLAKQGVNMIPFTPRTTRSTYIICDNSPHLTHEGLSYLSHWLEKVIIFTSNPTYAQLTRASSLPNITIHTLSSTQPNGYFSLQKAMHILATEHSITTMTLQAGGTLNASFLAENLVDALSIVMMPCLVGGVATTSLVGGPSMHDRSDLELLRIFSLSHVTRLDHGYIHLEYVRATKQT